MRIAWTHRFAQLSEPRIWFDADATPAAQIKRERHVVVDWVARTDIDVEATGFVTENAHQMHVFVALSVGDQVQLHCVVFDLNLTLRPVVTMSPNRDSAYWALWLVVIVGLASVALRLRGYPVNYRSANLLPRTRSRSAELFPKFV
jgi:hypothetical protein